MWSTRFSKEHGRIAVMNWLAWEVLEEEYVGFREDFEAFFPEVRREVGG